MAAKMTIIDQQGNKGQNWPIRSHVYSFFWFLLPLWLPRLSFLICRPNLSFLLYIYSYIDIYLSIYLFIYLHRYPSLAHSLSLSLSFSLSLYTHIYIYIYISGDSSLFLLLVPPPHSVNFSSQPVVRGPKVSHHSCYCVILHCIAQIDKPTLHGVFFL